jgi:hypothetical protein
MDHETAKTYQKLQELVGFFAANQPDFSIRLALIRTRATSAASIAQDISRNLARPIWNNSRRSS